MRIHKPSDYGFLRAAVVLLFLAVCAWTGAALYRTLRLHPASGEALQAAVAEGIPLTGVAIRREQLLCSRGGVTLAAEAGKRVARGAVLAVAADGSAVYAERSAVFFPDWDGLEALGPADLETPDVACVQALLERRPSEPEGAFGRLVFGDDWFFAALAPADPALIPDRRCQLRFAGVDRRVSARLLSVSAAVDGRRALLLRLTDGGADCLSLRFCQARLFLTGEEPFMNQEKEG